MARRPVRRAAGAVACLLALAVLGGCDLAPAYQRPDVPLPKTWDQAASVIKASWPAPDWWRAFGTPALPPLIKKALADNNDIGAAIARVRQADAQVRIAGAKLLPSLKATAGTSRSWDGSSSGTKVSSSFDANLAASYEVDLFGANRDTARAATASAYFSRFDRETVALTVASSVADTYFQALEYRDRLDVARRNLTLAERVLQVVEVRARNGAVSQLDLAQQRTTVATQRAAIPPLESQLQQTENALAILLGRAPTGMPPVTGSIMAITPPPVEAGLPSGILTRRPDIQAAEMKLIAANAQIGAARAALFPNIPLTANYGFASAALGTLLNSANLGASVGASVVQSIFSGGALQGEVDLAKGQYEELAQDYRKTVLTALGDVENALVAARRTAEQEAAQMTADAQAQEAFNLAELQYREGAVDLLTVLDAQRTLFQTEDQLVQTRFARLQAAVSLFRALGGGWQRPKIDLAGTR